MTRSRHITLSADQQVRLAARLRPSTSSSSDSNALAKTSSVKPKPNSAKWKTRRGRRRNPETNITKAVLTYLRVHPAVEWAERINSGAAMIKGQFIRFGFKGCSDIIGQLRRSAGGVFLAVETKAKEDLTDDQRAFLDMVGGAGGFVAVPRSVDDVAAALQAHLVSHQQTRPRG